MTRSQLHFSEKRAFWRILKVQIFNQVQVLFKSRYKVNSSWKQSLTVFDVSNMEKSFAINNEFFMNIVVFNSLNLKITICNNLYSTLKYFRNKNLNSYLQSTLNFTLNTLNVTYNFLISLFHPSDKPSPFTFFPSPNVFSLFPF